jgi:ligand-binding sensor domain-containing protein/serine phosphatase RsbU (regulator of sigma subunit)
MGVNAFINTNSLVVAVLLCFLFSCRNEEQQYRPTNKPEMLTIKGSSVSVAGLPEPNKISIDKNKLLKATPKNAISVPANLNVFIASEPKQITLNNLPIVIPGNDTFLLPKTIPAYDSAFYAGVPEHSVAKDMANKDRNPANFSYFSKLQGLKHGNVRCLLQDKAGNLWFGTYGGACRYDGKTFTYFTEKEGLSNNTVLCMAEDKNGNIWFGTNGGGVSKFDGKYFTHFTEKEGLSLNVVWSMLEDKQGNMWLGTGGAGVSRYDGKTFTHYTSKEGLSDNTVLSILEDAYGTIWFGTGGGVCSYNGKAFMHITEKDGLCNNFVLCIKEDKHGNLWFGTAGGVSCYDGNRVEAIQRGLKTLPLKKDDLLKENNQYVKTLKNYTTQEGLSNNLVWSILEDDASGKEERGMWFCTGGGGLSYFNGKAFTQFAENEGLTNNIVWSSLIDKSGNLWFGTGGGGVLRYDGKTFSHLTDKEGLNSNMVLALAEHRFPFEKESSIWLGTNGGGLTRYDGKSFTHYTENDGLMNNVVRSIASDHNSNLWIGTNSGLCYFDGKTFTHVYRKNVNNSEAIMSVMEHSSGNVWFGATSGGVMCYNGESIIEYKEQNGFKNSIVLTLLEDMQGNIWFGTDGGGLSCFNGKSFIHYSVKEGFKQRVILSSTMDANGYLWFGTDGGGAICYNGKTFTFYTEKQGLSNNAVMSVMSDKKGNIWFGTRFGLCRMDKEGIRKTDDFVQQEDKTLFKSYDYTDGFLGIGVYGGKTLLEDHSGNIWIGTNDRLSIYHPSSLDEKDTAGPNTQLTGVALFNENISWANLEKSKDTVLTLGNGIQVSKFKFNGIANWHALPKELSLAYNNNYLTFSFIGITMKQPKKVRYRFKLEGNDENWSSVSHLTEASYGNLSPGDYTFKVKAMNSDGYWSKEYHYAFTIRPPWWQTWWAYTLYILMALSTLFSYIKWRERALKQRQKELELKVDEATLVIRNQKEEVEKQKEVVEEQKHLIEEKHKEITDSINYAERIQRSFLATKEQLDEHLNSSLRGVPKFGTTKQSETKIASVPVGLRNDETNYFILFQPKDVVSGDFYWSATLNNGHFALVTADSTGHGVPGAIMSLLNITSLEKAIETETSPDKILNATRKTIIERLKKDGSIDGGKDGMDCSFLSFNKDKTKLQIAAAHNPVWIMRSSLREVPTPDVNGEKGTTKQSAVSEDEIASLPSSARNDVEVIEIKADKMPVGKHDRQNTPFTLHEIDLQKGDVIYTLTDGFPDQFGGPAGKKFMSKKLRELLQSICHKPLNEQQHILEHTFADWVGELEQIDDVTLIGIRV